MPITNHHQQLIRLPRLVISRYWDRDILIWTQNVFRGWEGGRVLCRKAKATSISDLHRHNWITKNIAFPTFSDVEGSIRQVSVFRRVVNTFYFSRYFFVCRSGRTIFISVLYRVVGVGENTIPGPGYPFTWNSFFFVPVTVKSGRCREKWGRYVSADGYYGLRKWSGSENDDDDDDDGIRR